MYLTAGVIAAPIAKEDLGFLFSGEPLMRLGVKISVITINDLTPEIHGWPAIEKANPHIDLFVSLQEGVTKTQVSECNLILSGGVREVTESRGGLFLNAHGRVDSISLTDGKICGGPYPQLHTDEKNVRAPCCALLDKCYRDSLSIVNINAADLRFLFTNACEAAADGPKLSIHKSYSLNNSFQDLGVTLVGPSSIRNGNELEISIARALFESGLPLWFIAHLLNLAAENTGLDLEKIKIIGNPFLTITRPTIFMSELISPVRNKTISVNGVKHIKVRKQKEAVSIRSRTGDLLTLYTSTKETEFEEAWIVGNGEAQISFDQQPLEHELSALSKIVVAQSRVVQLIGSPSRVNRIFKQAQENLTRIENLKIKSKYSTAHARSIEHLITKLKSNLHELDGEVINFLVKKAQVKNGYCPIDKIRLNCVMLNAAWGRKCPECDDICTEIEYESGWYAHKCYNCGIIEFGNERNHRLDIHCDSKVTHCQSINIRAELDTGGGGGEAIGVCILHGQREGFCLPEKVGNTYIINVHADVKAHQFTAKIYLINLGVIQVFTRRIAVIPIKYTSDAQIKISNLMTSN